MVRAERGFNWRLTHNFLFPPVCLLRRKGPVPGILAVRREGEIVNKSERRSAIGARKLRRKERSKRERAGQFARTALASPFMINLTLTSILRRVLPLKGFWPL